ncbi:hypothetical protein HanRHA438_Chr17g0808091 [Helianthus annuus]|nr:hypothetical protein HanRHA438_Chr17g0808091 [Helianthus annuus]
MSPTYLRSSPRVCDGAVMLSWTVMAATGGSWWRWWRQVGCGGGRIVRSQ